MKISQKQISLFTEDKSTFSREGSHASLTAQPESDAAKMMIATCGPKCLEQFERFSHVGLWARTFAALLIGTGDWYSTKCKLTWKLKGTKSNRLYFQLVPKTLHTDEIEFGLLLTPTSVMTDEEPQKMRERAEKNGYKNGTQFGSLLSQVKYSGMLPTPKAQEARGNASKDRGKRNLTDEVSKLHDKPGKSSQLNPRFVAEMMGFPPNWTELPFQSGETNQ